MIYHTQYPCTCPLLTFFKFQVKFIQAFWWILHEMRSAELTNLEFSIKFVNKYQLQHLRSSAQVFFSRWMHQRFYGHVLLFSALECIDALKLKPDFIIGEINSWKSCVTLDFVRNPSSARFKMNFGIFETNSQQLAFYMWNATIHCSE